MTDTGNAEGDGPDTDWPDDDVRPSWAYDGENIVWEPFHGFDGGWRITDEDSITGTIGQSDANTATITWDDGRIEARSIVDGIITSEYTVPE